MQFSLDYLKKGQEDLVSCQRDDIYLYDSRTGKVKRITDNEHREINPFSSNNSDLIAYQSFENGNSDIFTIYRDGTNKKLIVESRGDERFPRSSPDGMNIYYISIRDGNADICMSNIDGKNQIRLGKGIDAEFTPSGERPVYQGEKGLYLCNIADKTNDLILQRQISRFNIEISAIP